MIYTKKKIYPKKRICSNKAYIFANELPELFGLVKLGGGPK